MTGLFDGMKALTWGASGWAAGLLASPALAQVVAPSMSPTAGLDLAQYGFAGALVMGLLWLQNENRRALERSFVDRITDQKEAIEAVKEAGKAFSDRLQVIYESAGKRADERWAEMGTIRAEQTQHNLRVLDALLKRETV